MIYARYINLNHIGVNKILPPGAGHRDPMVPVSDELNLAHLASFTGGKDTCS
jgi:hypothetical protein